MLLVLVLVLVVLLLWLLVMSKGVGKEWALIKRGGQAG